MSSLPSTPQFEQTRWSLILRARSEDDAARRQALEDLCRAYWYPLYAYLRRSGNSTEDAQDLAQDFFARLMDGTLLSAAEPAKGRFRTLLLATLKNLATNTWRATQRQKRGGGVEIISLDIAMAEDRWQAEPAGGPPEAAFDRAWAHTVIDRAAVSRRSMWQAGGRSCLRSFSPGSMVAMRRTGSLRWRHGWA